MEIKNMRKVDGFGTLKAFFEIDYPDEGMTIKNCKLIDGKNGMFAAMPSHLKKDKKTGQDKYESDIWLEQPTIKKITAAAELAYHNLNGSRKETVRQPEDIPF